MRSGRLSWPALAALALLLAACNTDGGGPVSSTNEQSFAAAPNPPKTSEIRLEAGDKIRVTVFGEEKLSGDYQVDTGGYVGLPLAGSVKAAGLTPPELERTLEAAFKKTYLRSPKVTVEGYDLPAVLRAGRGAKTRRISLPGRTECLKCDRNRGRCELSRQHF